MPKIYEYFGFIFLFYANDHEPILYMFSMASMKARLLSFMTMGL
ncbi:MAG TPA: hypothetical protein VMV77_11385 [Bacteroidales bacterium]|nr:hypothetical protein [Bacteroidales bacterium]